VRIDAPLGRAILDLTVQSGTATAAATVKHGPVRADIPIRDMTQLVTAGFAIPFDRAGR
jgi:hypothetical protein